ncbi:hypothetical protein V2W45_1338198 [Cenococcum geophilum]
MFVGTGLNLFGIQSPWIDELKFAITLEMPFVQPAVATRSLVSRRQFVNARLRNAIHLFCIAGSSIKRLFECHGCRPAAESRWLPSAQRALYRPRSSCLEFRPLARFARESFVANGEPAPPAQGLPLLRTRRHSIEPNRFEKRPPAAAGCTTSAPPATRFSHTRKWLPLVDERVEGQPFVTHGHDSVTVVTTWLTRVRWPLPPRRCYGREVADGLCLGPGLHLSGCSELGPIGLVGLDSDRVWRLMVCSCV